MAQMIPDEVPPGRSLGERRLFSVLQTLPDDHLVYWEPAVGHRYPDFVVVMPDHGVLLLEVKGWRAYQIVGGDTRTVQVRLRSDAPVSADTHPVRQARDYMYALMDQCQRHQSCRVLLHADGPHRGRFVFPFGHAVIATQMTDAEMRTHAAGDLRRIFPADLVVSADEFDTWPTLTAAQLRHRLASFFDPAWPIAPMDARQVDALRAVLHPEVLVPPTPTELAGMRTFVQRAFDGLDAQDLRTLDVEQERAARELGAGHRLLFGVAGSGKTVVLLARARFLSEALPRGRVLVLCFNVALRSYLEASLRDRPNVDVFHFHGWGRSMGVPLGGQQDATDYGLAVRAALDANGGDAGRYDAVLIDEAQDFDASWFTCARQALKEPHGGDLLIVGDRNQTNYRRRRQPWASLGINAKGRSKVLRVNYRNTRPILEAASPFGVDTDDGEGVAAAVVDPQHCRREGAVPPVVIARRTREDETAAIGEVVWQLIEGTYAPPHVPALRPEEIGVLYRRREAEAIDALRARLDAIAPVVWIRGDDPESRERVLEPGLKLQTIHSAKGLQHRAVVLAFADQLGQDDDAVDADRRLLYVALTRPEDVLVVTCTTGAGESMSPIVAELLASPAFVRR